MATDPTHTDYIERTNAAIDYVIRNLDGELTLESVARVACFSPFHFHRVFRSLLGETLNQFIKRQRLERALYLMSHAPSRSLTEIALECGFSSSSDFSRSFKNRYDIAPSSFDLDHFRATKRKDLEAAMASCENGPSLTQLPVGENPDGFEATIRELPARTVAYIRVLDPFQSNSNAVVTAYKRLMVWAERCGLVDAAWLGYMWEDPEIVALQDCRYDVAVVLDGRQLDFQPEGEIGRFEFPAMRVADVPIRGSVQLELRAIEWLFGTWLPRSGFVPDDQPAFEAWNGRPFAHGDDHYEISCQLPIKRA